MSDETRNVLIGVGAPKCGSTYLLSLLKSSDEVSFPDPTLGNNGKELNFFSAYDFDSEGVNLKYQAKFESPLKEILCECSPSYFSHPSAPKRIKSAFPNPLVFIIVRDPVLRSYSAFLHHQRSGRVPQGMLFWDAVKKYPKIIDDSHYEKYINKYIEVLGEDNVYVVSLEDLKSSPSNVINGILDFCKLSPLAEGCFRYDASKKNTGYKIKNQLFHKILKRASLLSERFKSLALIKSVLRNFGIIDIYKKINFSKPEEVSEVLSNQLSCEFIGTNEYLRDYFDIDYFDNRGSGFE